MLPAGAGPGDVAEAATGAEADEGGEEGHLDQQGYAEAGVQASSSRP